MLLISIFNVLIILLLCVTPLDWHCIVTIGSFIEHFASIEQTQKLDLRIETLSCAANAVAGPMCLPRGLQFARSTVRLCDLRS